MTAGIFVCVWVLHVLKAHSTSSYLFTVLVDSDFQRGATRTSILSPISLFFFVSLFAHWKRHLPCPPPHRIQSIKVGNGCRRTKQHDWKSIVILNINSAAKVLVVAVHSHYSIRIYIHTRCGCAFFLLCSCRWVCLSHSKTTLICMLCESIDRSCHFLSCFRHVALDGYKKSNDFPILEWSTKKGVEVFFLIDLRDAFNFILLHNRKMCAVKAGGMSTRSFYWIFYLAFFFFEWKVWIAPKWSFFPVSLLIFCRF